MRLASNLPGATVLVALALATGCGSSSSNGAGSAADASGPATGATPAVVTTTPATTAAASAASGGGNGQADLVLTGAINQRLTGAPASCNYYYPSEHRGAVYTVDTRNFSLQVSDSEGDGRTVVLLNQSAPSDASYGAPIGAPGTLVAKLDLSGARMDLDLHKVLESSVVVHVSGTITCTT